jgi:AcrR family transcriptional regulator
MSSMQTKKIDSLETSLPAAARRARADGIESRSVILNTAARLATTRGLEALSIGELAKHIGMSKSGLFAHFKSKEELELATIETAVEIFTSDVLAKVPESTHGLARVSALTEAFLQHLARRTFPGGCFFATVAAQLAARPGLARDRVLALQAAWCEQFNKALRESCAAGELPRATDIDQLVFEVTAMLLRANFAWIVTEDEGVLQQARFGVENVLTRGSQIERPRGSRRRPKKN